MSEPLDRYRGRCPPPSLPATCTNGRRGKRWCKIIVDIKFHCTGRLCTPRGRILNFSPSKQRRHAGIILRATYVKIARPLDLSLPSLSLSLFSLPFSLAQRGRIILRASCTYRFGVTASVPVKCPLGFYCHPVPRRATVPRNITFWQIGEIIDYYTIARRFSRRIIGRGGIHSKSGAISWPYSFCRVCEL